MNEDFHLVVVADPVAKARPRTTFAGGKARTFTPRKTEKAEWQIRQQFLAEYPGVAPLVGPVQLTVEVHLAMPKSIPNRRRETARPTTRPDIDNYVKTVLDALNGLAFVDDSQIITLVAGKRYGVPPRWMIWIAGLGGT